MDDRPRETVEFGFCGALAWTVRKWGRVTHKHSCPNRTDSFCQSHPAGCPKDRDGENELLATPEPR